MAGGDGVVRVFDIKYNDPPTNGKIIKDGTCFETKEGREVEV
jgi:hypothetical protein